MESTEVLLGGGKGGVDRCRGELGGRGGVGEDCCVRGGCGSVVGCVGGSEVSCNKRLRVN